MQRRVRPRNADFADLSRSDIEQRRGSRTATPERVNAAAVKGLAAVSLVADFAERQIRPDSRRLIRLHGWPADFLDKEAAEHERLIANGLRGDSKTGSASQQRVSRIEVRKFRRQF